MNSGEKNILHKHGISVIIADGIRHCKVGLTEQAVFNVKKALINIFPNKPHCTDLFELNHRLAIIENFINECPTFAMDKQYFTPHIFQIATLKQSQRLDSPHLLSDLIFPTNKVIKESLYLLSHQSKQMLTGLAADLAKCLLNFRNIPTHQLPVIGQYVYLPDRIVQKQISSLTNALVRVISIDKRSITLKLANGKILMRHCQDIVSFNLNKEFQCKLDILDLPLYGEATSAPLTLNNSQFDFYLDTINKNHTLHGKQIQYLPNEEDDENNTDYDDENEDENDVSNVMSQTPDINNDNKHYLFHDDG